MSFDIICNVLWGSQIYFAKPDAMKGSLIETLLWCRPTIFLARPRVWETLQTLLEGQLKKLTGVQSSMMNWAKRIGYDKVINS